MPNKLTIENSSLSQEIIVELWATGNDHQPKDTNFSIEPGKTVDTIVSSGAKKMAVMNLDGKLLWKGLIPSYGTSNIIIDPERNIVTYHDAVLVNTLNTVGDCNSSGFFTYRMKWIIFISSMLILLILYAWKRGWI